jgi:C1A family cysteine protease
MSSVIKPSREFGQHIVLNQKPSKSVPLLEKHSASLVKFTTRRLQVSSNTTAFAFSFSLSSKYKLIVLNQGSLGACVANSYAAIIASIKGFSTSRLYLYYNARVGQGFATLEDSGIPILDSLPIFKSFGLPLESNWPYKIMKFGVLPDYSKTYKIANTKTVVNISPIPQTDIDIKTALKAGQFVMFGHSVYSSYMSNDVAKTGIIPVPDTSNESDEGGHCTHIVGWTSFNDIEYYIIRNSWGTGWGNDGKAVPTFGFKNNGKNGGFAYMPASYVLDSELSWEFFAIA